MEYSIQNDYLKVTAEEKGAELRSILSGDGTEYLWQGDPAYWEDRALNIFPCIGRNPDDRYSLDGKQYTMGLHGFGWTEQYVLTEKTQTRMCFTLTDRQTTFDCYPRHFVFHVIYSLSENVLDITFQVENRDTQMLYFAVGGHPGIRVPLSPDAKFTDYRLRFSEACRPRRLGFVEDCLDGTDTLFELKDDQMLPLRHELFDADAIVLKDVSREVTLEREGDTCSVTVRYPDMPYLGIWHTPQTDAPFVCIEPWSALPAIDGKTVVMEKKKDLFRLEAGETFVTTWQMILRKNNTGQDD